MNKTYIKPETEILNIAIETPMMAESEILSVNSDQEAGSVNAKGNDFSFNVWGDDED